MLHGRVVIAVPGLLLAAGLATAVPSAVAAPLFASQFLSLDTGFNTQSVAIGDFNGDGKLDLAAVSSLGVSVFLGHGDGTFSTRTDYITGFYPFSVVIGDLNGDGRPDLVVANGGDSTVSVLLGKGDGTFGVKTDYRTGGASYSVAIGDLNGDGKPDLAVTNYTSNSVSVLLGNGDGSYNEKTDHGAGIGPRCVAIGDLNGDGKADLVTANSSANTVSVLLGNGDGSLGARTDYGVGSSPQSVVIGDLNGDGKPDLAVANDLGFDLPGTVSVLLGSGDGSFGARTGYAVGSGAQSVAIGDLNGDGKPDLAVANYFHNAVSVLLGNGDGSFAASADYYAGGGAQSVAIGDLNGDGRVDLALANYSCDAVSILLGNGNGSFGVKTDYGTGAYPASVAIGDLNGDGKPDLVTANGGDSPAPGNTVSVLLGNGDGSFEAKTDFGTLYNPNSVAIGDLNGDRKLDLTVTNQQSNTVAVLLGNGDGSLGANTDYRTGYRPSSVAIADLNGDGKLDLAVTNYGSILRVDNTVSVLLGNGDGTFGAKADYPTGSFPTFVAIGDVNGDGKPDLVVANFGTASLFAGTVSVLLGNGDGSFGAKTDYGTGTNPTSVAIGDLNGDGKPDLAVTNESDGTVSILLGNGDGTFGAKTDFATGAYPVSVAIGDLNGDGKPDLAVANSGATTVSVLLGNGDGSFGVKTDYGAGSGPWSVAIGDLNGDGRPDLVVANEYSQTVSVLLNTGGRIPTPTILALVDAHTTSGRVELRWFGSSMAGVSANVYRQATRSAWTAIASITGDGTGTLRFADAKVQPGARYGYRLGVREGGVETFYGETWISVPGFVLALEGLRPNPAVGELVASFTLPSGSPARLELLDVAGRVWLAREVGDMGAGSHLVRLDRSVPAGIYWLRLTQGGRSLLARGAVVR